MYIVKLLLICSCLLGRYVYAEAGILLHSTLDSREVVDTPAVAPAHFTGKPLEIKTSGAGVVKFEEFGGRKGARLHGNLKNNELIRINPSAIDFSRSGRMDFWIMFNRDPHRIDREFYIFCDTAWPIQFQMEVLPYGNGQSNFAVWLGAQERGAAKQLYVATGDKFQPDGPWAKVRQGEWHRVTLTWWRRQGKDDELVLAIDGASTGQMLDLTGKLPKAGEWGALHIGGNKFGDYTSDVSVADLWIFDNPDEAPQKNRAN